MSKKHIGSTLRSLFVELGEEKEFDLETRKKIAMMDYTFTPKQARRVQIVRHPNRFLNNKVGTILAKDILSFYGWRVWLEEEKITVFVHEFQLAPANIKVVRWVDVLEIRARVFFNNLAYRLQGWLSK